MNEIVTQNTAGGTLTAHREPTGRYCLVFDGPDGLEVMVRFDTVEISRRTYELSLRGDETAGTIERDTEAHGAVWAWLDDRAEGEP